MKLILLIAFVLTSLVETLSPARANPHFDKCVPGHKRTAHEYCLVDGDTIWIDGKKLRMEGYDTPEPTSYICGGAAEVALAHRASDRLLQLLNSHDWTVEYGGIDETGTRTLVTIRIAGKDMGDTLIAEHLARKMALWSGVVVRVMDVG